MLLHVPNQRYKRLKIKNGQNDRSGNSSVKGISADKNGPKTVLLLLKNVYEVCGIKSWVPLGLDCRYSVKNVLFLYLVLCAQKTK